jgi:hypothetical protein
MLLGSVIFVPLHFQNKNVIESQMHLDFQVAQTPVRTILEYLSLFFRHADFHIGKKELVIIE